MSAAIALGLLNQIYPSNRFSTSITDPSPTSSRRTTPVRIRRPVRRRGAAGSGVAPETYRRLEPLIQRRPARRSPATGGDLPALLQAVIADGTPFEAVATVFELAHGSV